MAKMAESSVSCQCGKVAFTLTGRPILTAECMCDSCRAAGAILEALPGAPSILDEAGATLCVMYRKDRVACAKGEAQLREFRLSLESKTRRVVAACCNSAMFMELTAGHWIDVYGRRWPEPDRPKAEVRTMTGDLPPGTALPSDLPNLKKHSLAFFAKLIGAWAAMRFRVPRIDYVNGVLLAAELGAASAAAGGRQDKREPRTGAMSRALEAQLAAFRQHEPNETI